MDFRPIDSLFSMCLHYVTSRMDYYKHHFHSLPYNIKNLLLKSFSQQSVSLESMKELIKELVNPKTEELNLENTVADDDILKRISVCVNLRKLVLSSNYKSETAFTENVLAEIVPRLEKVKEIKVPGCPVVTDNVVKLMVLHWPLLELIDVSSCESITDSSLFEIAKLERLTCLRISKTKVSTAGIVSLADGKNAEILRELQMSKCELITDEALEVISKKCPKLKMITIDGCPKISADASARLAYHNLKLNLFTWTVR